MPSSAATDELQRLVQCLSAELPRRRPQTPSKAWTACFAALDELVKQSAAKASWKAVGATAQRLQAEMRTLLPSDKVHGIDDWLIPFDYLAMLIGLADEEAAQLPQDAVATAGQDRA